MSPFGNIHFYAIFLWFKQLKEKDEISVYAIILILRRVLHGAHG